MFSTHTRIHKPAMQVLRRVAQIRGTSLQQFLDDLANLYVCGLDGLMTWDLATLRKEYRYFDTLVCADVRKATMLDEEEGNRINLQ